MQSNGDQAVDVSVVLNVSREASFIERTARSLFECASFAADEGLRSELIIVLDNSDEATRSVVQGLAVHGFSDVRHIEVAHRSLGLARNSGIELARGEYVWLADADDLVSFNSIEQLWSVAVQSPRSVIFPEYLVAFGQRFWVAKYFGDEAVDTADFFFGHPYISRVFAPRSAFADLPFLDLRLSKGFAYEDWHLNCELRARGYRFLVARNVVFFYRQRAESLLQQANAVSARQIPHASLFRPETYRRLLYRDRGARIPKEFEARRLLARTTEPRDEFLRNRVCLQLTSDAARIDPGINLAGIASGGNWTNVFPAWHAGHAYEQALNAVSAEGYTDVVLLPWLRVGGGELYILDVLKSIAESDPAARFLVIAGEACDSHNWVSRLPDNADFVDLHRLCFPLDEEAQDVVALRLILGLGACARLHLKQSRFAFRLFARYRDCFRGQRVIFYRFCDPVVWVGQEQFEEGWGFDFISSHFEYLWRIVADHEAIVAADRRRIGVSPDKWVCIKARHQVGRDRPFRGWTRRLLWASRICKQKRPEVLSPLADLLQRELPDVVIEVYGSAEDGLSLSTLLGDRPNLIYAGPFVSFNADEVDRFDFFVYSAWYDGLPNVVLEAMSSGLPVIAPRVGGLPEAVITGTNGVLIDDCPDDGEMARRYLDALKSLYSSPEQAQGLRNAARAFISEGFSAANHQAQVKTALLSESGQ